MKVKVKPNTALSALYRPGETIVIYPEYDETGRQSSRVAVDGNGNQVLLTDVEFPRKSKRNPKERRYA